MLEKLFKLSENKTDVKTEVLAGVTTFMTMAYILAVNPSILSAAGMDSGAVFTATALAAFVGTLLMAVLANYPFALAPGMGLNAYFAYTVVIGMGYSWQYALTAVFAEGIIFIVLSMTNVREAIFNAIPRNLKSAVSVGIGLFIAFVGIQNAHIVIGGSTLIELFSLDGYNQVNGVEAAFSDVGITVLLAIIGEIITGNKIIKNVKGNILWGILITWGLGIICQFAGLYVPNAEVGCYSLLPDFSNGLAIPSLSPIFCKLDFKGIFSLDSRNIYNDNIRRKCIRSIRRRKNRSYICDNSNPFRTVTVPVTNLPCNSFFCNSTGTDHCGSVYAYECNEH